MGSYRNQKIFCIQFDRRNLSLLNKYIEEQELRGVKIINPEKVFIRIDWLEVVRALRSFRVCHGLFNTPWYPHIFLYHSYIFIHTRTSRAVSPALLTFEDQKIISLVYLANNESDEQNAIGEGLKTMFRAWPLSLRGIKQRIVTSNVVLSEGWNGEKKSLMIASIFFVDFEFEFKGFEWWRVLKNVMLM